MATPVSSSLTRQRNLILAVLLLLAVTAWVLLIEQATQAGTQRMRLTMGMGAFLFLATWVVMMVAMMFPTAAPMILMFARVQSSKRARGQVFVPAWVFVSGYLFIWAGSGLVAYLIALGGEALAQHSMWLMTNAARVGGGVLLLAGLYQLSPLKWACLSQCRSPLTFILGAWREGYGGAFRMGLAHGLVCLGCCWMLFVLLFPLGLMNVAAMALITLVIFAEKSLPFGPRLAQIIAILLIVYGVLVILMPHWLPVMLPEHNPM